ncbi:adenosylcobinamide-GDP ribazoletransferase [Aldersonia sp. NBC_00410]|uniref:adenosylcobinamide-GDP ribazoletransferase n=1 Tax=Aldersonia sp. NBC_00410 TaxID=2975954 RepID=UPI002258167A|nr:adenosylcobinamide-GDP ribazoletransferase [Aldersonia sp. NBC_00410]MCX5042611.1 adenosylcobinamide-GDP ribazoletransferase [Aldersonia sp. NBC_00410]
MTGIALAFSWLTVLPVRGPSRIDRVAAGRAIAAVPLVGVVLGALTAALLWALSEAGLGATLAGLLSVAVLALLSRGMHIDGLADTIDGLGCYGPPERAQEVMRSGGVGPFGVAALITAMLSQALAFGALAGEGRWTAIALAVTAGRVAVVPVCRRGVSAFSDTGFGALVVGTQPMWRGVVWSLALAVAAVWVLPNPWQGPLVVAVAVATAVLLARHCARRFGGISGDVLGAVIEVTVTLCAVGLTLR